MNDANRQTEPADWWNPAWRYRLRLDVDADGYRRFNKPVEVALNFSAMFRSLMRGQRFDENSLRVVEQAPDGTVHVVEHQFDPDDNYNAESNAKGALIILLDRVTDPNAVRRFAVYFDVANRSLSPQFPAARVLASEISDYLGQRTYKVATPRATYYYHRKGAGFASLLDADGNDWIGYRPGHGSAGEYRGIPNAGHAFHPGFPARREGIGCTSAIVAQGPLRVRILSESTNKKWSCHWDFYSEYARMTLLRAARPFWFMYEGTPGGKLDVEKDFIVVSSGRRRSVKEDWQERIPSPRWAFFGKDGLHRSLFFVHHGEADVLDQFWQMENNMTVFGFGREYKDGRQLLTELPSRFTIGFAESADADSVTAQIDSAFREPQIVVGSAETCD